MDVITDNAVPPHDRDELKRSWQEHHKIAAPKGLSTKTLSLDDAYRAQAKQHGGLTVDATEQLFKIAKAYAVREQQDKTAQPIGPGTRLVRNWHSQAYVVDILDKGYLWQGQLYGSLSEIARTITGTRWSGPRFFGVKA